MQLKAKTICWTWWHTSVIPALRRLGLEDQEFQTILGFVMRSYLKIKQNKIIIKSRNQTHIQQQDCSQQHWAERKK
jgi:hypothetical protein